MLINAKTELLDVLYKIKNGNISSRLAVESGIVITPVRDYVVSATGYKDVLYEWIDSLDFEYDNDYSVLYGLVILSDCSWLERTENKWEYKKPFTIQSFKEFINKKLEIES